MTWISLMVKNVENSFFRGSVFHHFFFIEYWPGSEPMQQKIPERMNIDSEISGLFFEYL